ncbi:MAG: DEAD/DEAH box helicase [Candidatus Omnitrophica bacterium]|nr:DEAD/DEAH box helicase [Candidatus Omnitrophota bacterium]MCM8802522.1 DEAD/DEAH box helicase [Candidatus Omnitrophota bacterium]
MRQNIKKFVEEIIKKYREKVVKVIEIKEREGKFYPLPNFILQPLKERLKNNGIEKVYLHQKEGLERLNQGENIIVTTPTGSGKSLIYNAFVNNEILKNPDIKSLYIFPTKALTQDQLKTLKEFGIAKCEIYDGDTPEDIRKKVRANFPNVILTNPDMLHTGILPFHDKWRPFFSKLRFVVIDEVHTYRGIFGSNVSHVIRRLRRILNLYQSNPQFILLSATINRPEKFAEELVGVKFSVVNESSSPLSKKYIIFWDSQFGSYYTQAINLLKESINYGLSTILFTNSRKSAELLQLSTVKSDRKIENLISSYRAGYLPEERREIERKLFFGDLKGVIATSALELGIDVGYLDVCILFGYPGTAISTWQRIGRVGRKREGVVIFIALEDALDQYFIRNPDEFIKRQFEDVIINFENEIISSTHIKCASYEYPLSLKDDKKFYGDILNKTIEREKFSKTKDGRYFYSGRPIHWDLNLRSVGEIYSIFDIDDGKQIGEIEEDKVLFECHPGAIYLHKGKKYEVISINFEKKMVVVERNYDDYYTQTNWWEKIDILNIDKEKDKEIKIKFGEIEVTKQVISYEKRREKDKTLIGTYMLNLPSQKFKTQSLWIEIPDQIVYELKENRMDFSGGIHAVEHSMIGIFPLVITCDRFDIGGYSFTFHQQTQKATIFIYDGYPGGIGITKLGFERIEEIIKIAYSSVLNCKCEMGCPSCIVSPKCGNNNRPLCKSTCIYLFSYLIKIY